MSGLRIELVREEAAFAALAKDWWPLWRRAQAPPFLAPAWLLPWRETFPSGRLLCAAVREGARLVGLAPFYIEEGTAARRLLPIGPRLRRLRMAHNRALRHGGYAIERIARDAAPRFLQELERLHGAHWVRRGTSGVLDDECVRRFHAAALPGLIEADLARCWLACLEGRAVAAYYGLCDGRRAFGYLTGFDPEYAFESPGAVIVGHAIECSVAEGCAEFHFLRGRESYKYDWGAADAWSMRRLFLREVATGSRAAAAMHRDGANPIADRDATYA